MNMSKLYKLTTPVRYFMITALHMVMVFSLVVPSMARAETQVLQLGGTSDKCQDRVKALQTAVTDFGANCSKGGANSAAETRSCVQDLLRCKQAEDDASAAIQGDGTNQDTCDQIASQGCATASAASRQDNTKDKKDAKETRKDLDKQKQESADKQQDNQKQAQEQANQLDDEATKADQEYRKNRKEVTDKLQKDLADIDDAKLKATQDAQKQYDSLDQQYIVMRDKIRRKQSEVSQLDLSWKVQCRVSADAAGKKIEADLDARMQAEDKIATNYQLSSAAGRNRRLLKQKRKNILNEYNQVMNRCLKGDIPPGADTKLAIDTKKNELHDEQALDADAAARLEKNRLQIIESMNQLEQSLQKKQAMIVQQANEALQLMDQDHQTNAARIAQRKQQAQMQAMQQQMSQMQKDQKADADLKDAKTAEVNASARAMCNIGADGTSGANNQNYKKAQTAKTNIDIACGSLDGAGCGVDKYSNICKDVKAAKVKQGQDGADATSAPKKTSTTK